ncbi:MAG TPA: ParM/StbA family protein [Bacteroidales bacterium]|nr:ParM/StbA family protein [Bacteroidales bacterium]
MKMILGIDAGNYETKVCTGSDVYAYLSDIGEYRKRRLDDKFSDDDMVWEYNGEKGFAGTLARFESEFGGTIKGKSKNHSDAFLRVLIAVYRYGNKDNHIIIGQPIDSHVEEEKIEMKRALKGRHELKINGKVKEFNILNVEIAPEGASALLSNPVDGLVRVIDIGSGTTNFATLYNLKRIDKDSFTESIGTEVTRTKDPKRMADKIYKIISGAWDKNDIVYLTGGGANQVYSHLLEYMDNCKVIKPKIDNNRIVRTKFANAIGFYRIAERLF